MTKLLRRLLLIAGTISAAVYVVAFMPLPFVQDWWDAGAQLRNDPMHRRHRIADGLLLSRSLINSTRAEIEAKLGPAPETGYFSNWDLVYQLGAERGFISIDSEWLVVRLDERGRASDARIVQD